MKEYHKIQTVFKRDPETKFKTLLDGDWSMPEFEYLQHNEWVFTEKVDGTNIRIMCNPYQEIVRAHGVVFGGKTDRAQIPAFLVSALEQMFHGDEQRQKIADIFPDGACLYGEGYGPKIQKVGALYRYDPSFVLFDVRVGDWWLTRDAVEDVAKKLGIAVVPIIGVGTLHEMVATTRAGFNSQWGDFRAEGIVARPSTELSTR